MFNFVQLPFFIEIFFIYLFWTNTNNLLLGCCISKLFRNQLQKNIENYTLWQDTMHSLVLIGAINKENDHLLDYRTLFKKKKF